jgi:tetratricopeptide (TPR) repeat protein
MRGRLVGCVVAIVVLTNVAYASPVLDKPSFTATPAELLAVAKAAPRGSSDIVVLREEGDVSYDDRGRVTSRWRLVFLVATQAGADDWRTLASSWQPSYQDKPKVRARVIDANGRVTELDASRITDRPSVDATRASPDDRRRLDVPLPAISVGSVVEEEVIVTDREPVPGGGPAHSFVIGGSTPIQSIVLRYSTPATKKLRFVAHGLPPGTKPKVATSGGRHVTTYVIGPLPSRGEYERFLPGEARPYPYVIASPVAGWSAIARDYRALVDKQIAAGPFALPAELPKQATLDTARAIVTWLQHNVTYSGVTFDDSTIVPSSPAATVKLGRANALDRATLLVALLRQAGIAADLALINVGPGPDLDRELPGLNLFDHVLVRARIGKADVWIDPVEQLTPPGRLPAFDQGRLALVVADKTSALIATPVAAASDSTVREVRTFELAEAGHAKVIEVSREGGVFEAEQRTWVRDAGADAMRKQLGSYAKSEYGGSLVSYTTSPHDDLTKPFELTVVASDAGRAFSGRTSIDIHLWPTDALKKLPAPLRAPGDDEPRRKHDFKLNALHVYEIENRLVIPPGFTIPTAAPDKVRALGPFKLVESQRIDGRTLIVTFRLDVQKPRLSPAEVASVQQAVRALRNEESVRVVIEQTALALAERGKFRDAIAEVNRLIKLQPKQALHRQQLAHVLLLAGAGEAARRAIRKAIELAPNNADAYAVQGWILQHDTLGNWLGHDHDHAGAVAALTKARKLDPSHVGAATDLASALELDARGRRFERRTDLRAVIAAWRAARALDDTADNAHALAVALTRAGDFAEAEKVLRGMRSEERRDHLLIAVTALASGSDAGIRVAGSLGAGTKTTNLAGAAGALMFLRHYDAMRALFAAASSTQAGTPQAEMIQKLSRADKPFKPTSDPRDVALEMLLAALDPARKSNVFADKVTREELQAALERNLSAFRRTDVMTTALIEDILRSTARYSVDGENGLWRVEVELFGAKFQVYLAGERRAPKVVATSDHPRGAGRHALRLLAKNDDKHAQRLLDWLARDLGARAHQDPNAHALDKLWGKTLPRTRSAIELAAAALAAGTDAARVIPILAACKPTTTDGQLACDWVLSDLYRDAARWSDLADHAREWAKRVPGQAPMPVAAQALALARLGSVDEAERLLADAVAKQPDNSMLRFSYADVALANGRLAEAIRRLEPLLAQPSPHSSVLNNVAWLKMVEGSDLPGAAALARQGVNQTPNEPHVLNTLAAIEAELGELADARKHLQQSARAKDDVRPTDADLYVHGRILEQIGLTDDAIAVYRRLKPPTAAGAFVPEPTDLAARRLKALGVTK